MVSGSSAFELLRGDRGDSLAGRTFPIRLEPLTFREYLLSFEAENLQTLLKAPLRFDQDIKSQLLIHMPVYQKYSKWIYEKWKIFYQIGGFPEPLASGEEVFLSDWLKEYMNALLSRDLKDLESAKDAERVEQTFLLLLASLGSFYSLRGISEVLGCSPNTVKSDILALRKLLWGFELSSVHVRMNRRIQSAKKFYPVDWILTRYSGEVEEGAVFENVLAALIHRHLCFENRGKLAEIHFGYFRDYSQKKMDFVVCSRNKLLFGLEVKTRARGEAISQASKIREKLGLPLVLVVTAEHGVFEQYRYHTLVISADAFAAALW